MGITHTLPPSLDIDSARKQAYALVAGTLRAVLTGTMLPGMSAPIYRAEVAATVRAVATPDGFRVEADEAALARIRHGRPPYDMKPGLLRGPKHRTARDGHPYTIVPLGGEAVTRLAEQLGPRSGALEGRLPRSGGVQFHTVSAHSNAASWWHPGKPGVDVAEIVMRHCAPEIEALLMAAWETPR